jgi:hypothetical protein
VLNRILAEKIEKSITLEATSQNILSKKDITYHESML